MTSTNRKAELEARLLSDPFDTESRWEYATLLEDERSFEAALEQWMLVAKSAPDQAKPRLRAALCCQRLDRAESQESLVAEAKGCDDFDPSDPLVGELEAPQPILRAVAGSPKPIRGEAEIVSINATEKIRFADVVGMEGLKKTLRLSIIEPFLRPGLFARFKKRTGGGVLLYGPPGCGKTLMARAVATECNARFTAVGISDVLSMWSGQSEDNLAALFEQARAETPAVLFFDELDALAFSRSKARSDHTRTLVNEFLSQLDGLAGRNERLLVLGATNMPWDVDDAMKRPGRFDRQVFVPPPDADARTEIFRLRLRDVPVGEIDWVQLGKVSRKFSGADIDGVIEIAKDLVLGEILDSGTERSLEQADLLAAIEQSTPSTVEWLSTARNLVKFGGGGRAWRDVERYLRREGTF